VTAGEHATWSPGKASFAQVLGGQRKGAVGDKLHEAQASRMAEQVAGAGSALEAVGPADAGTGAPQDAPVNDSGDLLDSVLRSERSTASCKEAQDDDLDGIVVNVSDRDLPKVLGNGRQSAVHVEREERVHGMNVLGILDMPSAETLGVYPSNPVA